MKLHDESGITLLQVAAGCALLVFGLRALAPPPSLAGMPVTLLPPPADAVATIRSDRGLAPETTASVVQKARNSAGIGQQGEGERLQTAGCVTACVSAAVQGVEWVF